MHLLLRPLRPIPAAPFVLSVLLCLAAIAGAAYGTHNRQRGIASHCLGKIQGNTDRACLGVLSSDHELVHDDRRGHLKRQERRSERRTHGGHQVSRRRKISGDHQQGAPHREWARHRPPHPRRRHWEASPRPPPRLLSSPVFDVLAFGAAGDGSTNDTQAFLDAWHEACQCTGTAVLKVPTGRFLVGPLLFLDGSNCTSSISMVVNGEIIAPEDPALWGPGGNNKWIYFNDVTNFVLTSTGGGTINGRGQNWWAQSCKRNTTNPCVSAPRAITVNRATNIVVSKLKFLDSQAMHLDFNHCDGLYAADLTISAPEKSPNTDGIHLQDSINAVLERCSIGTGDDCISIQTGCSNVLVRDISCGPGHGISIGGLGKDNSHAEVSNVQVYNVTLTGATNGLRIKTWQGASGSVNNVTYTSVQMNAVSNPIIVDQYYCDSTVPCKNQTSAVKVSNILYDNIKGTSATDVAVRLECSVDHPCKKVVMQNVHLTLAGGEIATASCQNAEGSAVGVVQPASCLTSY